MRYEILPLSQREIYNKLAVFTKNEFVLFGGTAVALQLGHRVSVDFDFFRAKKLNEKLKKEILAKFDVGEILQNEPNALTFLTENDVKISCFGDIDFVSKTAFIRDDVLCIASLESLLATKLKATFDRAECKDYKDICELLQHVNLWAGIKLMCDFFKSDVSKSQILKNLTYFDDGDLYKLSKKECDFLVKNVCDVEKKHRRDI